MVRMSIASAWLILVMSSCGLTSEESQAQQECKGYYSKVVTWLSDQDVSGSWSREKELWNFVARLNRAVPLGSDPWNRRYRYIFDHSRGVVHVCSNGPDEQPDTSDDIFYPRPH